MRTHYQEELDYLNGKLLKMAAMVQNIINISINSLKDQDLDKAREVFKLDDEIDELEIDIEKMCINLIALQQPIATDLRKISTILKIITDLERMGDHAVNIAKVTLKIGNDKHIKPLIDIPFMASKAEDMLSKAIDAYMEEDIEKARELEKDDEEIDLLYEKIHQELLRMMIENNSIINQSTNLIFVGRYLERIADHSNNIAERIIYMVTGERVILD